MRKIITLMIVSVMVFSACSSNDEETPEENTAFETTFSDNETASTTPRQTDTDWSPVSHVEDVFGDPSKFEIDMFFGLSDGMIGIGVLAPNRGGAYIGFMNEDEEIVVLPQYYQNYWASPPIAHFSEGLAAVCGPEQKWGFIDKTGEVVIPFEYNFVRNFSGGLAAVSDNWGNWGFIDKTGEAVIPINKYVWVKDFKEDLAAVVFEDDLEDRKWGFIDKTGEVVIPFEYRDANDFSEGLAAVRFGDDWQTAEWGFIDKAGKTVIPFEYGYASFFSEGLAGVIEYPYVYGESKLGFIDKSGNMAIPFIYNPWDFHNDMDGGFDRFPYFSEGLACLYDDDRRVIYISKTGEVVITLENVRSAGNFHNGLARIHVCGIDIGVDGCQEGYIDKTGKIAIPLEFIVK